MNRDYWPTQDWRQAEAAAVGMRTEALAALAREVEARFESVNALLVGRSGYLVVENYYNGSGPGAAQVLASVTKSFTSTLVGIAIDKGYLAGVEQKVMDFFPEFEASARDDLKRELSLEHLLTMTAGFQWRSGARGYEPMLLRLWRSPDWTAFILGVPVRARLLGRFQYNSAASHLLSVILTRATGKCAREFANEHLFGPLGIGPLPAGDRDREGQAVQWVSDPQGNSTGGWGLNLTAVDMARFGFLYLNGGRWEDAQIVSSRWVEASTSPHTPGYGYQWWLRDVHGVRVYAAVGRGGQHIFCLPDQDVVVVIASRPGGVWRDRWPLLEAFVLPAIG
ncbi:MAG: serine hydrolase [Thermoflexales bacterium]|nr:serine hydrolase [Thermoflexales bacterium]